MRGRSMPYKSLCMCYTWAWTFSRLWGHGDCYAYCLPRPEMKVSLGEVWPFLVLKPSIKASYGSHKAAEYLKKKKKIGTLTNIPKGGSRTLSCPLLSHLPRSQVTDQPVLQRQFAKFLCFLYQFHFSWVVSHLSSQRPFRGYWFFPAPAPCSQRKRFGRRSP